jgi:hypothetical protein
MPAFLARVASNLPTEAPLPAASAEGTPMLEVTEQTATARGIDFDSASHAEARTGTGFGALSSRSCSTSAHRRPGDLVAELEPEQCALFLAGLSRKRKPRLEDRVIARALARWLDQELGRGMPASLSEAHTARADQLAGKRARRTLARRMDKLVYNAQHQRPPSRIGRVPPCRDQVDNALPLILVIRSRLLSEEPLAAQGIAGLKTLLGDRRGPCYVPSTADSLSVTLREISELLQVEEPEPGPFEAE